MPAPLLMIVAGLCLVYLVGTGLAYRFMKPAAALLLSYLAGWLLLPVGVYPSGAAEAAFPYWLTGNAVPSDMLWNKVWLIPVANVAASMLVAAPAWRQVRWGWHDLVMALWCASPLWVDLAPAGQAANPAPLLSALYLFAVWGGTWCLGRVHLASPDDRALMLHGMVWATVACLPLMLVEGLGLGQVHSWLWGPHPFRLDGTDRYVGYRPMGLFEHGNQYGIWVSLGAFAALAWWRMARSQATAGWLPLYAVVLACLIAVQAQSVGALMLALACWAVFELAQRVSLRRWIVGGLAVAVLAGAVVVAKPGAIEHVGRNTALGQTMISGLRAVGRGSLFWRVSQDLKVMPLVKQSPIVGMGQWDWWRPKQTRPWGLHMLVAGQFGLLGLALMLAAWMAAPLRVLAGHGPGTEKGTGQRVKLVLALVALASVADAMLNSFIYFPGLLAAAALVQRDR
ncbi:MAG: hypothetical protein IPJ08_09900 [Burkholderiales bacterium]|nr:hypothetical protein [Burkholderiales bacterium]